MLDEALTVQESVVCDLKESTYLVLSFRSHTTAFLTEQLSSSSMEAMRSTVIGLGGAISPAEHHRSWANSLGKTKELAHFCGVLDSVDGDRIGSAGGNRSSQAYDRKLFPGGAPASGAPPLGVAWKAL